LHVIAFMQMMSNVMKQVKETEGAVRYDIRADFPNKQFWTFSIWKDQDSLGRFVIAESHATAIEKFTNWAGKGTAFVEWTSPNDLVDWPEATERLKKPTFYYEKK
jgi:hypothetical protein